MSNTGITTNYASALKNVTSTQAALLLSTQGLTNAQIAETLAMKEGNTEAAYQAMVEAGLLKSKISLTNVNLQSTLESVLGSEAKAKEAMNAMILTSALEGQGVQTVKLTSAKLKEAVMSGKLTEAQAQEIAMRTGCTFAMNTQSGTAMPAWIANITTMTKATWRQVQATAAWLAATPAGWATMAVGAIAAFTAGIVSLSKRQEEYRQATADAAAELKNSTQTIDDYAAKYKELHDSLMAAIGDEEETYHIKKQLLDLQAELNDKYGDEYGKIDLITNAYRDQTDAINNLSKAKAEEFLNKNRADIQIAADKMTEEHFHQLGYNLDGSSDLGKDIASIANQYKDAGIEVLDIYNDGRYDIQIKANADDAEKTINKFMSDISGLQKKYGSDNAMLASVLDYSSISLGKINKISEKYADIFHQALISEIATTDLSAEYQNALDAVEAYNEAILKSSDPFNDSNVDAAYNHLQSVKSAIQENETVWGKYSPITDELFDNVNTGSYEFAKAISGGNTELSEMAEQLKGMSDIEILALKDANVKKFTDLTDAAKKYGLDDNDVIGILEQLGIIWNKALSEDHSSKRSPFSKKEMISAIKEMSEGFDSLNKIKESQNDENPFDFALLDDATFTETFQGFKDEYDDFIDVITKSPKDVDACQAAYDSLVTAWLNSKGILDGLSEENAGITKQYLSLMGITNADILVENELAKARSYSAFEANNLVNATSQEILAFINESAATDEARKSLSAYLVQKMLTSTPIDSSGDISALANVVASLGLATSAWQRYFAAKQRMAIINADPNYTSYEEDGSIVSKETVLAQYSKIAEDSMKTYAEELELKARNANYGSGGKLPSSAGSGGGSGGSAQSRTFDWIQRKIEILRDEYSKFNDEVEDSNNSYRTQLNYLSEAERYLKEIVATEQQAENIYFANWEQASAGLSDDIKSKITSGNVSIDEYTSNTEAIEKAQSAWDSYSEQRKKRLEDEKQLQAIQQSGYEKKIAWHEEEIETLKDRASASQQAYMEEIHFMEQAVAKEEQIVSIARKHASEAEQAWKAAVASIQSTDIAKIMNGTVNLNDYEGAYREAIEAAVMAAEKKADADQDLADKEQDLEDSRKEAYEKALEYIEAQQDYVSEIKSTIESEMDLINDTGGLILEAQYEDLIMQNDKLIEQYEDQIDLIEGRLDEVEEESADYYELKGELEQCTQEINNARAEQAKWNRELQLLPVERINKFLAMLDLIKTDLQDFMDWEVTLGQANSREEYQQLIDLESERIEKLKEQLETQKGLLSEYEYGSELYQDTLSDINDIADAIAQAANEQQEFNQSLLNLPVDNISKLNENLQIYQDILQKQLDEQETALSAAVSLLDQEIDKLSRQQDEITAKYQEQIDPVEEKLDALDKQNEALQIQRNLEQSLYDLERAKNQKTNQVIRNGEIRYEADMDAVRDANQSVADSQYEKAKYELEQSRQKLEELRDQEIENLQTEIDRLDTIKARWEDICDLISQAVDEESASAVLGEGWKDKLLSGNDQQMYEDFYKLHSSTELQADSLNKQIESNERIISQTQVIIDRFNAQEITLEQANAAIDSIVSLMSDGYAASDQLSTQLALDQVTSIREFSQQTNAQITESLGALRESFTLANDNNIKIVEIMGTQTEKLEEIRALDEENQRLYEEMLAKIAKLNRNYRYHDSDDSGSGDSHWDGGGGSTAQGIYTSEGNGHGSYQSYTDPSQNYVWHKGIENGLVGKATKSRESFLRHIATEDLEPKERYIKVLEGEAVLTEAQQNQIAQNFHALNGITPTLHLPTPEIPYRVTPKETSRTIEFTFGDLNLQDVRDVNGFAKAMKTQFEPLLRQELSKY